MQMRFDSRPLLAGLLLAAASTVPVAAQDNVDPFALAGQANSNAVTQAALMAEPSAIAPGQTFSVGIKLTHKPGWHSYYLNPGFVGKPLKLTWDLPEGFVAGPIQWPTPHVTPMSGTNLYGYEGTNYFLVEITASKNASPGTGVVLKVKADWQACKEICINETATLQAALKVASAPVKNANATAELEKARQHLPLLNTGWKASLADTGKAYTISLTAPAQGASELKDLYFYAATPHTDAQAAQTVATNEDGYVLTIPKASETPMGDPLPSLLALEGILASKAGWLAGQPAQGLAVSFPLGASAADSSSPAGKVAPGTQSLLEILALAFLGGIILNLMPCVFPVLGLKIMGFVEQSGEDPKKIRKHGLVFAAGLLLSLWVVAGILIALLESGKHFGWGFQLNDARFLSAMIILLFILGLNLIGVFEIGTSLTGVGSDLQHKKGYSGSFFTGILTTLVATPCTGPFLGVAMGFALQQPAYISLVVFTALGLGIAFPYVLLSFNPKLIKKLPPPGAWMETLKKALAFPLFLWVVFLLNGFGAQTGRSGIVWLLTALVIISIAAWIYGSWATPIRKPRTKLIARLAAVVVFGAGIYSTSHALSRTPEGGQAAMTELGELKAYRWTPTIVRELQGQGHPVFVDYTADT